MGHRRKLGTRTAFPGKAQWVELSPQVSNGTTVVPEEEAKVGPCRGRSSIGIYPKHLPPNWRNSETVAEERREAAGQGEILLV